MFSRYNEQRKKHGATEQAVRETIRICKEQDVLKEYLESKEQEVIKIMSFLFDQDEILRMHDISLTAEVTEKVTRQVTKQEQENGIRALVKSYKKFDGNMGDAIVNVVEEFGISKKEAEAFVRKYW